MKKDKLKSHLKMNKNRRLLKEFSKNLDFVDLVYFLDILEIKVDYLLSKDLEINLSDDYEKDNDLNMLK